MPVRDENALETVVRDALGHVEHEVKQVFDLDIDRAVKIHVVRFVSERNDRHQQNVARGALGGCFTDRPDEKVVHIERQVRAMILH